MGRAFTRPRIAMRLPPLRSLSFSDPFTRQPHAIPEDLTGARVLDVGTFDGSTPSWPSVAGPPACAVDNEQDVAWIRRRFGIDLVPGAGFRAIAELLGSGVDYRRLDALGVDLLGATFDVIFCFGILHRVEAPLTLMHVLGECLAPGGGSSSRPTACAAGRTTRACSSTSAATCTRATTLSSGASAGRASIVWAGSPACAGSSSWTRPRSRATRGSSARSRRADQAAWSRRSTSSARQLVRAVSGQRVVRERSLGERCVVDRARGDGAGLGRRVAYVEARLVHGECAAGTRAVAGEELEEGDRLVARPVALAAPTSSRPRSRGSCRSDGRSHQPRW
jgi:SAM-dependent methyltransferase